MSTFELSTLKFCERVKEFSRKCATISQDKSADRQRNSRKEKIRFGNPKTESKEPQQIQKTKILLDRRDWKFCKEIHLAPANGHVEPVTESD